MSTVEREVRAAEDELRAAMLSNDVAALTRLLHDELKFAGPDGTVVGKQDDLDAHKARRLRLTDLVLDDVRIRLGNAAQAISEVRALLTGTFDGVRIDGAFRYTRIWQMTETGWKVIGGSVSREAPH